MRAPRESEVPRTASRFPSGERRLAVLFPGLGGGGVHCRNPSLLLFTCLPARAHPNDASVCFPLQRAKIGQGTKAPEEKTTNTISKSDTNGNRDRMKLTDFNFLMVLGKGSFGKVRAGVAAVLQKGQRSRQACLLVVGGLYAREGASEKQIDVHHMSPRAPGGKWIDCCATNKPRGDPLRLSEEVTCKWRPEGGG